MDLRDITAHGSKSPQDRFAQSIRGSIQRTRQSRLKPAGRHSAQKRKADEIVDFLQTCVDHATVGVLLSQFYNFGIFGGEIIKQVKALTSENNTILLSETNTLLRDIIGDSLSPFIYERTGLRLHHFLIDEFQDTSRLQWENLRPLVMESLDNLNDNLIIGDVQAVHLPLPQQRSRPAKLRPSGADPGLSGRIILDDRSTNYRSSGRSSGVQQQPV